MRVPLNVGLWFNTFWSIDLMDLHFPERGVEPDAAQWKHLTG